MLNNSFIVHSKVNFLQKPKDFINLVICSFLISIGIFPDSVELLNYILPIIIFMLRVQTVCSLKVFETLLSLPIFEDFDSLLFRFIIEKCLSGLLMSWFVLSRRSWSLLPPVISPVQTFEYAIAKLHRPIIVGLHMSLFINKVVKSGSLDGFLLSEFIKAI